MSGSFEAHGNDRPKIRFSETSLASSFWTMPTGAASGTAADRARLTKKARVATENCILAGFERLRSEDEERLIDDVGWMNEVEKGLFEHQVE